MILLKNITQAAAWPQGDIILSNETLCLHQYVDICSSFSSDWDCDTHVNQALDVVLGTVQNNDLCWGSSDLWLGSELSLHYSATWWLNWIHQFLDRLMRNPLTIKTIENHRMPPDLWLPSGDIW